MSDAPSMVWRTLSRREVFRTPRIVLLQESVLLPDGRVVDDYEQYEMGDFVIVLAETPDGLTLCERQYKHGLRRVVLTLPGGAVDAGEAPLAAARRELLEETGYEAPEWSSLGSARTHCNQGGSTVHYFRAQSATLVQPPHSGDLEEMEIELLPRSGLVEAIARGEFGVVADLAALLLGHLSSLQPPEGEGPPTPSLDPPEA